MMKAWNSYIVIHQKILGMNQVKVSEKNLIFVQHRQKGDFRHKICGANNSDFDKNTLSLFFYPTEGIIHTFRTQNEFSFYSFCNSSDDLSDGRILALFG